MLLPFYMRAARSLHTPLQACVTACCTAAGVHAVAALHDSRRYVCRCEIVDLAAELPLEVSVKGPAGEVPLTAAAGKDGCYACSYTAATPGFYRLELLSLGKPVAGSPHSVQARASCHLILLLSLRKPCLHQAHAGACTLLLRADERSQKRRGGLLAMMVGGHLSAGWLGSV